MDIAKNLYNKAKEAGQVKERPRYLQLIESKDYEVGGEVVTKKKSTGPHKIKVISAKEGIGKNNFTGKEQEELQMIVVENGIEKFWNVPLKDKDGNLNYVIENLAEISDGEEFIVEAKKSSKGPGYFFAISRLAGGKPENSYATSQENSGEVEGGESVPEEDLPF